MNKEAPAIRSIVAMVVFVLSCFGLVLFLWLSFGGTVPFKPKGYRFQVAFPEAATLASEADVRIAGVSVGKVRTLAADERHNRTVATLEIDTKYAPLHRGVRAILRQKTLLGETYVELTPGDPKAPLLKEGDRLPDGSVQGTTEIDEIFSALDKPTRDAYQSWQQTLAAGISDRGQDLNDSLSNLPGFVSDGSDLLGKLDTQKRALGQLVRNTGVVFGALSENESQLRTLVTASDSTFKATASQSAALERSFQIFPTFLDETKATMTRLQRFAVETSPLIDDLRPVARDLRPTLRDVKALAPDLERLFVVLDPLITAARTGIPATTSVLRGAKPVLGSLGPFLGELNPILQYLELYQGNVSSFIDNGAAALADTTHSRSGGVGHYLRQFGPIGAESLMSYSQRLASDRGNSYLPPGALWGPEGAAHFIPPEWDCNNTGVGEKLADANSAGCWVAPKIAFKGLTQQFPHVAADVYSSKP